MNEIEKWIEALRSGDFTQGVDYARQIGDDGSETYCCLGVFGVIMGEDIPIGQDMPSDDSLRMIEEWLGLPPVVFTRLNDIFMSSFSDIADFIVRVVAVENRSECNKERIRYHLPSKNAEEYMEFCLSVLKGGQQ